MRATFCHQPEVVRLFLGIRELWFRAWSIRTRRTSRLEARCLVPTLVTTAPHHYGR